MVFPAFLKKRYIHNEKSRQVQEAVAQAGVNTVCHHAQCPNKGECFASGHLTFMILGKYCTRQCSFCGVHKQAPEPVDTTEPLRIVSVIQRLSLKEVIITSVTRDDLEDEGASQYVHVIQAIRTYESSILVEVLVPDFHGRAELLRVFVDNPPDIFGHNVETVPRLYPYVRAGSSWERSLGVLSYAHQEGLKTKTGIMVGLGEKRAEVEEAMKVLIDHGCQMLTIGQYLKPNNVFYEVQRFVEPEEFQAYQDLGKKLGFSQVISGPFVRSSYRKR